MGDQENGARPDRELADMSDGLLAKYREKLEEALALDELPPLSEPREELQRQLVTVLAEQAERLQKRIGEIRAELARQAEGGSDAQP
jgi:hypothetical protein